jgi:hypothetical protein
MAPHFPEIVILQSLTNEATYSSGSSIYTAVNFINTVTASSVQDVLGNVHYFEFFNLRFIEKARK